MNKMTVDEAQALLKVKNQSELARAIGVGRSYVSRWKGVVPDLWRYKIAYLAQQGSDEAMVDDDE